ncbi:MAG: MFS transporter [Janthinobacterium lividum]
MNALEVGQDRQVRGWLAVASLAAGTFVMVTSEFLPIGLLTEIARDLHATNGAAGLMVTIPGLVAAIAAPLLVLVSGSLDRRYLLWLLSGLLVVSNLIVATASDLPVILLGRILLGISVGGFWGFGAALAGRLVAPDSGGRAVTIVFAGISIGTVLGMPAGTLLGHAIGWRAVFICAAALSALVLAGQILLLPRLPVLQSSGLKGLLSVFSISQARVGLVCVVLVILGHFTAYTYITPFLEQRAGAPAALISLILLAYGAAGFFGNLVGGALVQRNVRTVLAGFSLLLAGALIVLSVAGTGTISAAIFIIIWGFAFGGLPICLQTWLFRAAPETLASVSAVFVTVFQLAIAGGAFLGGVIVNGLGLSPAMAAGGITALAAALVIRGFGESATA